MNLKKIFLLLILKITSEKNKNISFVNGIYRGDNRVGTNFKYQVFVKKLCEGFFYFCGGTVIDEYHIITAAHCVYDTKESAIRVFAGSTNYKIDGNIYHVKKIHVHGNFKPWFETTAEQEALQISGHPENDIAVLTLANILPIGENITKVQLPTVDIFPCSERQLCIIAGWGNMNETTFFASEKLLWTVIEILNPLNCLIQEVYIRNNEMCAKDPFNIAAAVHGDNGGGLVCDEVLVGVLSGGRINKPSIYANVYHFKSFINDILEMDRHSEEEENDYF